MYVELLNLITFLERSADAFTSVGQSKSWITASSSNDISGALSSFFLITYSQEAVHIIECTMMRMHVNMHSVWGVMMFVWSAHRGNSLLLSCRQGWKEKLKMK